METSFVAIDALGALTSVGLDNTLVFMQSGSGTTIEQNLTNLWEWGKVILNVIVILAAGYYGVTSVVKYFQGDQGAGKSVLMIIVGLLIWFAIIVPVVNNYMEDPSNTENVMPWDQ